MSPVAAQGVARGQCLAREAALGNGRLDGDEPCMHGMVVDPDHVCVDIDAGMGTVGMYMGTDSPMLDGM